MELVKDETHRFRQASRGRPGPNTQYVRKTRTFWRLAWRIDEENIAYDRKSDGMYPLLTNDRAATGRPAAIPTCQYPSFVTGCFDPSHANGNFR